MDIREQMSESWDAKADKNAYHWVDSTKKKWNDVEEYYARGKAETEHLLIQNLSEHGLSEDDLSTMTALDIGCGTGRLVRGMAPYFKQVIGIDISKEMLSRAKNDNKNLSNAQFLLGNGVDLDRVEDSSIDVVFSYIVFQHIPKRSIIFNYIREIERVLKPGGYARFQVRGYPGRLRLGIPSYLYYGNDDRYFALDLKKGFIPFLIINKYDTVYGAFFKENSLKNLIERANLDLLEINQDKNNHRYLWATVRKQ